MKFTKRVKIALATGIISVAIAAVSLILAAEYGATDPLISKSYLDSIFFPQVTQYIDGKLSGGNGSASSSTNYEVITINYGQLLVAKEGSLEIILRPGGSAKVYSDIPSNGIADLTSGAELLSNAAIPVNSYCLIPRADGRGIICTSGSAYVMVRGSYEIK